MLFRIRVTNKIKGAACFPFTIEYIREQCAFTLSSGVARLRNTEEKERGKKYIHEKHILLFTLKTNAHNEIGTTSKYNEWMHQTIHQNQIVWKLFRFEFQSSKLFLTVVVSVISFLCLLFNVILSEFWKLVKMMKCECHQKNYLMFNFLDFYATFLIWYVRISDAVWKGFEMQSISNICSEPFKMNRLKEKRGDKFFKTFPLLYTNTSRIISTPFFLRG